MTFACLRGENEALDGEAPQGETFLLQGLREANVELGPNGPALLAGHKTRVVDTS